METLAGWIELDGAVNVRDLGDAPLTGGGTVRAQRLIRADNLQNLSPADVRLLVDDYRVRAVADLRTGVEVANEGPGPLTREPGVTIEHLSLFQETASVADIVATDDGPVVLPWQGERPQELRRRSATEVYLSYLDVRPDSILAALRLVAHSDGATIVHCAAGKDRTGVVVALALDAVGVQRGAIVEDYARTGDRLDVLLARLAASHTYAHDISLDDPDKHRPRASTMERFLAGLDERHGGSAGWLAAVGWTSADQRALTAKLTLE